MPDEVLSDGFAISARLVDTHAVLVEILGELDIQTVPQARSFLSWPSPPQPRRDTSSSTSPACDFWPRPESHY
jgi:hypothetical protein